MLHKGAAKQASTCKGPEVAPSTLGRSRHSTVSATVWYAIPAENALLSTALHLLAPCPVHARLCGQSIKARTLRLEAVRLISNCFEGPERASEPLTNRAGAE